MRSDSIASIAKALSQAQGEITPAEMDSVNPFLKNKYASLGSVTKAIQPILKKYGLSYTQIVEGEGGNIGVTTVLMHESGEWIESHISMSLGEEKGKSLAQAAGGIITYLRRYSLSALFGVYAEEDTDAQKVERKASNPAPAQPPAPEPIPAGPELKLETAMQVKSSDGRTYGEIDSATLGHMARTIAEKIKKGGYPPEEREGMEFKLSAIRTLLASERPEPGA
jgi:hypothetical protein